ncbi:hypothetical protein T484DRAFT_1948454 [Baffinella frigidus]|nr:hypothetical protein T484DRAFT_1948454 [Cryptophyta sp. CCMP2293]
MMRGMRGRSAAPSVACSTKGIAGAATPAVPPMPWLQPCALRATPPMMCSSACRTC